jgi:hypothetical protein
MVTNIMVSRGVIYNNIFRSYHIIIGGRRFCWLIKSLKFHRGYSLLLQRPACGLFGPSAPGANSCGVGFIIARWCGDNIRHRLNDLFS